MTEFIPSVRLRRPSVRCLRRGGSSPRAGLGFEADPKGEQEYFAFLLRVVNGVVVRPRSPASGQESCSGGPHGRCWGDLGLKRIYVGNLSFSTTKEGLEAAFGAHGQVSSVAIILDRDTGRSRGFAFVEMPNDGEADEAISAMNGVDLDGRTLTVNEARPREDRPGGGGGGGGGYRGRR